MNKDYLTKEYIESFVTVIKTIEQNGLRVPQPMKDEWHQLVKDGYIIMERVDNDVLIRVNYEKWSK